MEYFSDTALVTVFSLMALIIINMHFRVRDLEKKLGK